MNYVIALLAAAAAAALAWLTGNKAVAEKITFFNIASPKESDETFTSLQLKKSQLWLLTGAVGILSVFAVLRVLAESADMLYTVRLIFALLCLTGAGCFDLWQKRIPNLFPLLMVVGAVGLLGASFLTDPKNSIAYITACVLAASFCGIFLTLSAVLTKDGIGAGDIKLVSALALLVGIYPVIGTLLVGTVGCCGTAMLQFFRKKKASKSVPFGPFLLFGYILSLLMNNI